MARRPMKVSKAPGTPLTPEEELARRVEQELHNRRIESLVALVLIALGAIATCAGVWHAVGWGWAMALLGIEVSVVGVLLGRN